MSFLGYPRPDGSVGTRNGVAEVGAGLYSRALEAASGRQTKAAKLNQDMYNGIFIIGPLA